MRATILPLALLAGLLLGPAATAGPLIDPVLDVEIPSAADTLRLKQIEAVTTSSRAEPSGFLGDLGAQAGVTLDVSRLLPGTPAGDADVTAIGLTVRGGTQGVVQPYVGVGPALFLTRFVGFDPRSPRRPQDVSLADGGIADRTATSLGLQLQAGIRLSLSPDLDLFGEFRFARPSHDVPGRFEGDGFRPASLLNSPYFQGGLSVRF
jgi:hypothetical protein